MTHGGRARRFDAVISSLANFRRAVGSPAYLRIEELSGELQDAGKVVAGVRVIRLPHSTSYDLFTRPGRRLLRWEMVVSFWATLRLHAERKGIDTSGMCSLDELERHYRAAHAPPAESPEQARSDVQPAAADSDVKERPRLPSPSPGDPFPGRGGPRPVDVDYLAELRQLTRDAPWRQYQDAAPDWLEPCLMLEPELAEVRIHAPLRIPGLLQNGEYARRVAAHDNPGLSADEVTRKVELRLLRQELVHRPEPLKVWAVLHERVLRDGMDSPPVWRAQIRHLIGLSGRANITLQVVTEEAANEAFADGPLTVMRFPESYLDDLVLLEQRGHGVYLTDRKDVGYFATLFASLTVKALTPQESERFLQRLL
ncbi:DUF5753 domain-containing protein [Spirillospora sp. NPDC127200]